MKTIKIIELLTKIANGEEVPKKIRLKYDEDYDEIYEYNQWVGDYTISGEKENYYLFSDYVFGTNNSKNRLNDEVEILDEEDEFEDVEEITIRDTTIGFPNGEWTARNMDKAFAIKINQLIKNQKKIIERLQHENSKDNV